MSKLVAFQNPKNSAVETVKIGFSWTSFMFADVLGIPLFNRRLYGWGVFMLIWSVVLSMLWLESFNGNSSPWLGTMIFFGFFIKLFLGFRANQMAAKNYIKNGWKFTYPDALETKLGQTRWGLLNVTEKTTNTINEDSINKLEKLASLKDKGLITDEEFLKEKSKIIA